MKRIGLMVSVALAMVLTFGISQVFASGADDQIYRVKIKGVSGYIILDTDTIQKVKVKLDGDKLWAKLCEIGATGCGGSEYEIQFTFESKLNGTTIYIPVVGGGGTVSSCDGEAVFEGELDLIVPGAAEGELESISGVSNGELKIDKTGAVSKITTKGCCWYGEFVGAVFDAVGSKCKFQFILEKDPSQGLLDSFDDCD